jgi:sugar lactone lactonase YvrE
MAEARVPIVRLMRDAGAMIGESPVWQDDSVHWTDPVSRRLFRASVDTFDSVATASSVWSLGALPDGSLVGSLDDRFCSISGSGELVAGPPATIDPGCRFNDMAVDAKGGLWVGMMHKGILATCGSVFHARSLQERPVRVADGLGVPNGMKLSGDGRTLFIIDTLERALLAYPVNQGTLGEPVIVSDFLGLPGKPDGMALAPDGSFWVAMWGGSCVVQLARDGAFLRQVSVPAPHVSSLCFAGTRLLVTTSRMRLSPQALLDHPGSGALFEILLEPA